MVMGLTKLDCLLKEKVEQAGWVPGAVLLVRHRQEVIFHEAYGLRETVPETLPMTRDTLFDLASLTKPVSTALLVMQMWRQGRLRLEQTLSDFFTPLKDPAKRRITVASLLSNRSGFPAWRPYYRNYTEGMCPISRDEMFHNVVSEKSSWVGSLKRRFPGRWHWRKRITAESERIRRKDTGSKSPSRPQSAARGGTEF